MSALSDLFTDIATEIRGKTGETGTMKPAEFPDKIAGIETGGGGGGGMLPAGLYFEPSKIVKNYNQTYRYFKLNGETYLVTYIAASTSANSKHRYFYKVNSDNTLTLVLGATLDWTFETTRNCELNGKAHFFGGSYHSGFDGTSTIQYTKFASDSTSCCVYNNKLYVTLFGDTDLLMWNEETDVWESVCLIGSKYSYRYLCVFDGVMYLLESGSVYEFNGSEFVLSESGYTENTLPFDSNVTRILFDGYIYSLKQVKASQYSLIRYKQEITDNPVEEILGFVPGAFINSQFFADGDDLHVCSGTTFPALDVIVRLIEETEE